MESQFQISDAEASSKSLTGDSIEKISGLFRDHGALWLKNVFEPAFISGLLQAYLKRYENLSRRELNRRFSKVGDERYMVSVKIKGVFNTPELYANSVLMPILYELLGQCVISSLGPWSHFPAQKISQATLIIHRYLNRNLFVTSYLLTQ